MTFTDSALRYCILVTRYLQGNASTRFFSPQSAHADSSAIETNPAIFLRSSGCYNRNRISWTHHEATFIAVIKMSLALSLSNLTEFPPHEPAWIPGSVLLLHMEVILNNKCKRRCLVFCCLALSGTWVKTICLFWTCLPSLFSAVFSTMCHVSARVLK